MENDKRVYCEDCKYFKLWYREGTYDCAYCMAQSNVFEKSTPTHRYKVYELEPAKKNANYNCKDYKKSWFNVSVLFFNKLIKRITYGTR